MTPTATNTTEVTDATSVPASDAHPTSSDVPTTVHLSGDLADRLLRSARWQQ